MNPAYEKDSDEYGDSLHCYASDTAPSKEMRTQIFSNLGPDAGRCPYCGLNEIDTLDHYLPKETFAEFAVFPPNLVPCCHLCNWTKGTRYRNNTSRLFLFPYFDEEALATDTWLFARVDVVNHTPEVEFLLRRPASISASSWATIEAHCRELSLLKRYTGQATEVISEAMANVPRVVELAAAAGRDPSGEVELLFREQAARVRNGGLPNSYRAAVFDGMADAAAVLITLI